MKFIPHCILVTYLVVSVSGCSQKSNYYPVNDKHPRKSSLGFSVSPPTGKSWFEKLQGPSLIYYKKTERDDYLLYAKASEVKLPNAPKNTEDFIAWVKSEKEVFLPPERYKNITFSFQAEPDISEYCLRYSRTYEDHGKVVENAKDDQFFAIENSGLYCLHPDSEKIGVDVSFVERLPQGFSHKQFRDEVNSFMQSLIFQSLNQS